MAIRRGLRVQLFVDRRLGESKQLPNAVFEPFGLTHEAGVEFELQIDARAAGPVIGFADLAVEADVDFEHGSTLQVD